MKRETEIRFTLRLPETLRNRLATDAARNQRSLNGEIVARLMETGRKGAK